MMLILALLFERAPLYAGEYTAVEIGSTGESLPNRAQQQDKHYTLDDDDLSARIGTLMADVDRLLERLHALPPELAGSEIIKAPADAELGTLFALALQSNPELARMRGELAVLAARTRQEGAKKDPMLGFQLRSLATPFTIFDVQDESGVAFSLSQEIEGYGKRGLRRRVAQFEERLLEHELAQAELDLLFEITEAYYNVMGNEARLRALNANIELMRVLIELAQRKYTVGKTPQAAVLSAQVELGEMEAMAIELEVLTSQERVKLSALLGYPAGFEPTELKFDAPFPLPPQIDWNNDELMPLLLAANPKYQRLNTQLEQQVLEVELARREYHPDYTLSAEYEVSRFMQDTISAGVEIPLFTNKEERQDARVQEMYAGQDVTRGEQAALETSLRSRLETYQYELAMHGKLVDIYRTVLVPQARLALESNIAAYSANMMDFADLVMSQQTLLTQEQELEQNYIHILHTLTDLQLITSGAFDPSPYSSAVAKLEFSEPAISEARVDELVRSEEKPIPRSDLPFVQQLELPAPQEPSRGGLGPLEIPAEESEAAESAPEPAAPAAEAAAEAESAADESGTEAGAGSGALAGDFYAPFEPQAGADEEEEEVAEPAEGPEGEEDDDTEE